jgi:hypothetical protein
MPASDLPDERTAMIRHVVLFAWQPEATAEHKQRMADGQRTTVQYEI